LQIGYKYQAFENGSLEFNMCGDNYGKKPLLLQTGLEDICEGWMQLTSAK